jgi:hypothetical protein
VCDHCFALFRFIRQLVADELCTQWPALPADSADVMKWSTQQRLALDCTAATLVAWLSSQDRKPPHPAVNSVYEQWYSSINGGNHVVWNKVNISAALMKTPSPVPILAVRAKPTDCDQSDDTISERLGIFNNV